MCAWITPYNDKFSIFGHFIDESILQTFGTTMWSGDNVPTSGNTFSNPSYSAVVHLIHTIRPNLLNEVAFNYNANRINIIPIGPVLGAPSDFAFNRIFTGPNVDDRIPSIDLNGTTSTNYTSNWTPWINKYNDYQIRDDVSWTRGAHQFKMGGSWALYKKQQDIFTNTQGNFQFNGGFTGVDFADFLLGDAQQYSEDAVHDHGDWNNVSWAAYFQDNWRVNRKLTLDLGLRWDGVPHTYEANHRTSNFYPNLYTTPSATNFFANAADSAINPSGPGAAFFGSSPNPILAGYQFYLNGIGIDGENGIPKGLVQNHWAAFGPRIGFAYDLGGDGKTVIRGGFGLMYERIQGNDMYNAGGNVPFSANATVKSVLLQNPKETTAGAVLSSASLPIVVPSITGLGYNMYKLPTSAQFSMSVERALGDKAVFSAAYVGTQNRHQSDYREINLPAESDLPALVAGTSAMPFNGLVQYLGYNSLKLAFNEANADYNSLQMSLRGRVQRDLQLQVGYTLSKATDPTTGGGNGFDLDPVQNPYLGWKADMGPSVFDRRDVAFFNFVYDIPFFRNSSNGFEKTALGGWQLATIVTAESGAPLNITVSGTSAASVFSGDVTVRPNAVGSISYPNKATEWFDTSAFLQPSSLPACATGPDCFGSLGHDAVRGPGRDNWNMTLFKNFNFTERARLEFRVDAFNIWNHTQFVGNVNNGGIGTSIQSCSTPGCTPTPGSNFGAFTSAYDPRIMQIGLKFVF